MWVRGPLLLVADDEATVVDYNLGVLKSNTACDGTATNADQYSIILLVAKSVRSLKGDLDLIFHLGQRPNLGVKEYTSFAEFIDLFCQGFDKVPVGTG